MAKTWSALRKRLEGFLCPELKKRVHYTVLRYRPARTTFQGDSFSAAIVVDGKEVFRGISEWWDRPRGTFEVNSYSRKHEYRHVTLAYEELLNEYDDPYFHESVDAILENERKGLFGHDEFMYAAINFIYLDPHEELYSDNCFMRIFSILDRRVGKRTLRKIYDSGEWRSLPPWMKQFYELRFSATLHVDLS